MTKNRLHRLLWSSAALVVWSSVSGCTSEVGSGEPDIADEASIATLFSAPSQRDEKSINLETAPQARRVEIMATDFRFSPSQLFARPGETLIVTLGNAGTHPHSIVFELSNGRPGLSVPLQPGQRAQFSVTMPRSTGKLYYYCPVGDHRQRGMQGIVTVSRP
jgi:plastocyanin